MEAEIKLEVIGLVYNQALVSTYSLVLKEEEGSRRFSVMIGEFEAQSIALKINKKTFPRPLVHDLIKDIISTLSATLNKILIYDLVNDIFYAQLFLETSDGKAYTVDARTSDAIALAVRSEKPIYIKKSILDIVGKEVGATVDTKKELFTLDTLENMTQDEVNQLSDEVLQDFLSQAVTEEKYELAVKLRNGLAEKKNKNIDF